MKTLLSPRSASVLLILLALSPGPARAGSPPLSSGDKQRQQLLLAALSSPDWLVRRRSLQELREARVWDPPTSKALIELATSGKVQGEAYDLVDALGECWKDGRNVPEQLAELLNRPGADLLCCGMARGGSNGATARILQSVTSYSPPNRVAIAARVALASMNVQRADNLAVLSGLLSDVATRDLVIGYSLMAAVGPWASEALQAGVESALRHTGEASVQGALLAASWNGSGAFATAFLSRSEKVGSNQGVLVTFQIAGARLSQTNKGFVSPELVQTLANSGEPLDRGTAVVLVMASARLFAPEDEKALLEALRSSDPLVLIGACRICWAIGRRIGAAEPDLWRVLLGSPDERVRGAAALALGSVAGEAGASKLDATAKNDASDLVKASATAAANLLRLQAPP